MRAVGFARGRIVARIATAAVMLTCAMAGLEAHDLNTAPPWPPQIQAREFREKGNRYGIHIQYPYIAGAAPFNAAVRRIVVTNSNAFRKEMIPARKIPVPYEGYLTGQYTAAALQNGTVSALLSFSEYTPGAAHPWEVIASVNYDTRGRRVLRLSDLFRPGAPYLARLSELAIADLESREYAEQSQIRHGAAPVESNFEVFTITDTALILHFAQSQVAPGVAGKQQVEIPLATLRPLLRRRAAATGL